MIFSHTPHNLEVLRTWGLRLGHYTFRSDRVGEGRVGVLMDGTFIPFPDLERSSSLVPAACTGREFNEALVDPPRNPEMAFEQDDTRALAGTDFGGALSRVCGPSPVVVAEVDLARDDEKVASSSPGRAKSCEDATPNRRHHATQAVTHDRIHVNALLSYLASHQRILEIADNWGFASARDGDIRRGSIVIITQVNTVEVERIEGILRQPISDRVRIAHELFKETSRDRFHVASFPSDDDADRAQADCASGITLRGKAWPVFPSPCACPDDDVDDTKPAPTQGSRPALGENAMVPSTSRSGPPVSKMMFIHYARAMERPDPSSIWRRGVDAARFVGEIMTYTFEEDYFPLDELLKHMLAVSCADVAVASTMQLLEIFEDEDEMPAEAENLRRALRRIKPSVVVEKRYDSSGRRRRVALLSRTPSDTANTICIG